MTSRTGHTALIIGGASDSFNQLAELEGLGLGADRDYLEAIDA